MNDQREIREITSLGEWLNWRQGLVTASAIGALFNAHPHVNLADLVAEKRGERRGEGDNPSMRAGRILEPAVIAALNEERPELQVRKASTFHILPEHRFACTPDAFGEDGALLVEAKTVSPAQWDAWHGTAPLHYLLQTLASLIVTDAPRGLLACLIRSPSYPLHLFEVRRHPAAEAKILAAVAEFWRRWDAGEHPEPQGFDAELAAALDDGSHVDLSGDNALPGLLDEREMLKQSMSAEEARLKEIDYQIRNRIGKARIGWLPGWQITFATSHRKETVLPARNIRTLRVRRLAEQDAADE